MKIRDGERKRREGTSRQPGKPGTVATQEGGMVSSQTVSVSH